jgi:hypothetical protein
LHVTKLMLPTIFTLGAQVALTSKKIAYQHAQQANEDNK